MELVDLARTRRRYRLVTRRFGSSTAALVVCSGLLLAISILQPLRSLAAEETASAGCGSVHVGPMTEAGQAASYFEVTAGPGETATESLLVANPEPEPCSVLLMATYGKTATNSGDTYPPPVPGACVAAGCWLSELPERVSVPANSRLTVPFDVTIPLGTQPGQYLAGVLVRPDVAPVRTQADGNGSGLGAVVLTSVGVGVAITVPGPLQPSITIADVSLDTSDAVARLRITERNLGNTWEHPAGGVELGGATAASGAPGSFGVNSSTILPGDTATLDVPLTAVTSGKHRVEVTLWYAEHTRKAQWSGEIDVPNRADDEQPAELGRVEPGRVVYLPNNTPGWIVALMVGCSAVSILLLVVLLVVLRRRRSGGGPGPGADRGDHDEGTGPGVVPGSGHADRWARVRVRPGVRRAAIAVIITAAGIVLVPSRAHSAVALVQKGPLASGSGATATATLSSASAGGNLLVATLVDVNSNCATDTISAPAGWIKAAHTCRGSNGPLELWYYADSPSGISSVVFNTGSAGAAMTVQLSEWSGVAASSPLDQVGTNASAASSTSLTVSTAGAIGSANELAITAFTTSSGLSSFTPGSGWTALRSSPGTGFVSDYQSGPSNGATVTEAVTSNPQTTWAAVIATFRPACAGGSLTVAASPSITFPAVALNAYDKSSTLGVAVTLDDQTGSGSGWHLTGTSTTLSAAGGKTLPTTATTVTAASASAAAGNCSLPTNSTTYPVTLPAAASAPTAATIYGAATATGRGPTDLTLTAKITVPAKASAGSYTSTWTLTAASGP